MIFIYKFKVLDCDYFSIYINIGVIQYCMVGFRMIRDQIVYFKK